MAAWWAGGSRPGRASRARASFFRGRIQRCLGFPVVLIEVAAVAFEAFGEAEGLPVGGFVEGAGVFFGVVETLGQKRLKAVPGFEFAAESAQGERQALAGEIGAAGALDDIEAAELDDELEPVGTGHGVPADVVVAFLEALGSSAPAEHGDEFGTVGLGVGAVDSLPENMPGGTSGLEVVALVEDLAEVGDFGLLGGGAQHEVVGNEGGLGHQRFHGKAEDAKMRAFV